MDAPTRRESLNLADVMICWMPVQIFFRRSRLEVRVAGPPQETKRRVKSFYSLCWRRAPAAYAEAELLAEVLPAWRLLLESSPA